MQTEWWKHVGFFNDWPFNNSSTMIKAFLNISFLVWYIFSYSECLPLFWFLIVPTVFVFSFDLVIKSDIQKTESICCRTTLWLHCPVCGCWVPSEWYTTFFLIKRNSNRGNNAFVGDYFQTDPHLVLYWVHGALSQTKNSVCVHVDEGSCHPAPQECFGLFNDHFLLNRNT